MNLHQSLQLVKLAVKVLKVVSVQSSEAIVVHDLHQHAEGLLLGHLKGPVLGLYTATQLSYKPSTE